MAKKTYRAKASEEVNEVTFPTGGGEFKTLRAKDLPYSTEDTEEQRFFDEHPLFTDRPAPRKGGSRSRSSRNRTSTSTRTQSAGSNQQPSSSQEATNPQNDEKEENS